MKSFEMNNRLWAIEEVEEQEIIDILQKQEECKILMANGLTDFQQQVILLNKNIHPEMKKQTLYHELMHCYIRCYITFDQLSGIEEEMICDICANSHDIIHKIVEGYFGNKM